MNNISCYVAACYSHLPHFSNCTGMGAYVWPLTATEWLMNLVVAPSMQCSLIPRSFPPPVFDCLQYANMEGEGLGDLFMYGEVRQKVDIWGAVPNCNNSHFALTHLWCSECCHCECSGLQPSDR